MAELSYLFKKILNAYVSKTLHTKSIRFFTNQFKRYLSIPLRSYFSSNNLRLDLRAGYLDHRLANDRIEITHEHIKRIKSAYRLAKEKQKTASAGFKIEGLWDEWIRVNYDHLINGLEVDDNSILYDLLNNMLRERFTRGLGGYDEWYRYNSLFGKRYIRYVWGKYHETLQDLQGNKEVIFPKIGNPCGVFVDNKILPIECLRHTYRAEEISNLLTDKNKATVVEIGGGYGGLAYQVMAKMDQNTDLNFVLYDIPEALVVSTAFLLAAFPNKHITLLGEEKEDNIKSSLSILPHFLIDQLESASVDLFYNSCSFSEMDQRSASKYLSIIERCCRKYFLHDNHELELKFKLSDKTYSENLLGSELRPDPNFFKLIYKKPRTHGLPEDASFKHFEYLYEKINK